MEIKIPWIGDTIYYKLQAMEIQDEFGITVEEHRSADDGLTALLKQKYPLIIVNDKLTRDGLILPEGLSGEDFCGIACYVIGEVRKNSINQDTPIVVPRFNSSLTPEPRYMAAGATKCVTLHSDQPRDFFNDQVREYLR